MMHTGLQIAGWTAIVAFFAFVYWKMCKAQAADPRRRGEHAESYVTPVDVD